MDFIKAQDRAARKAGYRPYTGLEGPTVGQIEANNRALLVVLRNCEIPAILAPSDDGDSTVVKVGWLKVTYDRFGFVNTHCAGSLDQVDIAGALDFFLAGESKHAPRNADSIMA